MFINTGIFPFKDVVVCQGTIVSADEETSDRLKAAAQAYVDGDTSGFSIVEKM